MEGQRGLREDAEIGWKLVQEYSEEEVGKFLEDARGSSRCISPDRVVMDGALTEGGVADVRALPPSSSRRPLAETPAEEPAEEPQVLRSKRKPAKWLEESSRTKGRSEGSAAAPGGADRRP